MFLKPGTYAARVGNQSQIILEVVLFLAPPNKVEMMVLPHLLEQIHCL